jgi:ABC-2 type transport system ATP-binding protein
VLELDDLHLRFGDTVALDGVSFAVEPGQVVGFLGRNGAGKTTAMRVVLGLLAPDRGTTRWEGLPLDADQRRRFGYMPEERGLYPRMSVLEQLEHFAVIHGRARRDARADALAWSQRLGLGDRAGDRAETLSLGNQQRAQFAAALVHDPVALVLDEPFSGIDPDGADALAAVLEERRREGVAILFSSHQLELVERLCQVVAIIESGRIVAFGDIEEVRRERAGRRYRIVLDCVTSPAWARELEGVAVAHERDGSYLLELADDVDEQRVLYAAQIAGRLRHFSEVVPSLADVFRELVR